MRRNVHNVAAAVGALVELRGHGQFEFVFALVHWQARWRAIVCCFITILHRFVSLFRCIVSYFFALVFECSDVVITRILVVQQQKARW